MLPSQATSAHNGTGGFFMWPKGALRTVAEVERCIEQHGFVYNIFMYDKPTGVGSVKYEIVPANAHEIIKTQKSCNVDRDYFFDNYFHARACFLKFKKECGGKIRFIDMTSFTEST
jgi:hypothetical protein